MITESGGNAVVHLSGSERIVLTGDSYADLTAGDFSFAAPPSPATSRAQKRERSFCDMRPSRTGCELFRFPSRGDRQSGGRNRDEG